MKKGRPTKIVQINIEKEFYQLYLQGINAETAARKLNTNRNTAYKYYKKFSDQIHTINENNFFEEIKSRIKQLITSYDYLLFESHVSLDSINSQIQEHQGNILPQHLLSQKISIIKEIRNILNEKIGLELKIPLDDSLEEAIDKVILKHEKSGNNN